MNAEPPVGWACCWMITTRRPPFHRGNQRDVHATEAEARRQLQRIQAAEPDAVGCVVPVWPKPPDPTSKAVKRSTLEALGMPVQLSPKAQAKAAKRSPPHRRREPPEGGR
jgi:hypothetical protein